HNCRIQCLQPLAGNRHAVFLVTESEAVTYHYELDLRAESVRPDPRIAHTLSLSTDEQGNVLQSVAVVYPRLGRHDDDSLSPQNLERIRAAQQDMHLHLGYTENRYTGDVDDATEHRLRVPCEVLTYELTGIRVDDDRASADPRDNQYFTLDALRRYR